METTLRAARLDEPQSVKLVRWVHAAIARLLCVCLWGAGCMVAGGAFFCLGAYEFGAILALVGLWMALLSFAGVVAAFLLWVPIVFFCHARYSLGAMLLAVLAAGLGVSLTVMNDPVAKLLGGLLVLGVVGVVIAEILGQFDPVQKVEIVRLQRNEETAA